MLRRYPRLVGLKIYAYKDNKIQVVASSNEKEIGEAGIGVEGVLHEFRQSDGLSADEFQADREHDPGTRTHPVSVVCPRARHSRFLRLSCLQP